MRRVWVAKDSPRTTAGDLLRLVESWGQKPKNYINQTSPTSPCCSGGFQENKLLAHPKTNSSIFSCQTRLELQALASMLRWNNEKSFLSANPPDEFSTNRDKKYHMSTVKYTAGSWFWACFSAGGPGRHGIMDYIKYQQLRNQNLTASVRNLITDHVRIFYQCNNPKLTQTWVTEHKMNLLPWLSLSSDLNPTENDWGELKRRRTNMDLERFWMKKTVSDLLSGVLQTLQAL